MDINQQNITFTRSASFRKKLALLFVKTIFLLIASSSILAVLAIIFFIAADAIPFFKSVHLKDFFTSIAWYPTATPPNFGALAIFYGSLIVTVGATMIAVPLGILVAFTLSDFVAFKFRQAAKPLIEILAAIPSVAYGFFALVVFAPFLQQNGGKPLALFFYILAGPIALFAVLIVGNILKEKIFFNRAPKKIISLSIYIFLALSFLVLILISGESISRIKIGSGTNALNVSIILGIMALPSVISISEDALLAAGKELREAALALGATKSEMVFKVVIPAARSGIIAAVILGIMRALGETMVVWMASGNAAQISKPPFNFIEPVRTLTATIAGDMGEADQMTGSMRFHVLFAMAFILLLFSFISNLIIEKLFKQKKEL